MPVTKLLCEGTAGSPDARLLAHILRGLPCQVEPCGGKQGLRARVEAWRAVGVACCAVADRDFPRALDQWSSGICARGWRDLGWEWQRKEIENYLFDPEILTRVYRWEDAQRDAYASELNTIWDSLGPSTAARIALTIAVPRFERLETAITVGTLESEVEELIRARVGRFLERNHIDVESTIEVWRSALPLCAPDGQLRADAAALFAGKDVRAMLQKRSGTAAFSKDFKKEPDVLTERVLQALADDPAPHQWLPEWTAIRDAVEAWGPDGG